MNMIARSDRSLIFIVLAASLAVGCSAAAPAARSATSPASITPVTQLSPGETREISPTVQADPGTVTTPTPAAGSTQVSPKDGMVMVFVPAGEFQMGGGSHADDSVPVHTVHLSAFWIDQTEITNEMFANFVERSGYVTDAERVGSSNEYRTTDQGDYWEDVEGLSWNHPHGANSDTTGIEDHPVVHVSWNDSLAYCSWAERRLPSEAEWEKAASWDAQAGRKNKYPWGSGFDGTLLNFCDKNCSLAYAIKYADDGFVESSPVGSYPSGASPYGALDMVGNVLEWVADWYAEDYYRSSPPANPLGPNSGESRVARGGAWATNDYYVSTSDRFWWEPSFRASAFGFRCALSP